MSEQVSEQEKVVLEHLTNAWNAFMELPKQNENDLNDFRISLDRCNYLVGIRSVRRQDKDFWHVED